MRQHIPVRLGFPLVIAISLLVILSCSDKNKDMRKSVKENYGEPDLVEEGGYGTYEWMRYVYAKRSINRVYEFQKSASGCGGSGEWYVYRYGYADYMNLYALYSEASIAHSPVVSAPAGDVLHIESTLSDPDHLVLDYNLYYRTPGAEEFMINAMTLSPDDEDYTLFFASISGEEMTPAGIEYYIEMTYYVPEYDKLYSHRLPETGIYAIDVTGTTEKVVTGGTESSKQPVRHLDIRNDEDGASPISP